MKVELTEAECDLIADPDGPWIEDDWDALRRLIEGIVQKRMAAAWEEGYEACEADEKRANSSPFHVSSCDCLTPTTNPYEDE